MACPLSTVTASVTGTWPESGRIRWRVKRGFFSRDYAQQGGHKPGAVSELSQRTLQKSQNKGKQSSLTEEMNPGDWILWLSHIWKSFFIFANQWSPFSVEAFATWPKSPQLTHWTPALCLAFAHWKPLTGDLTNLMISKTASSSIIQWYVLLLFYFFSGLFLNSYVQEAK